VSWLGSGAAKLDFAPVFVMIFGLLVCVYACVCLCMYTHTHTHTHTHSTFRASRDYTEENGGGHRASRDYTEERHVDQDRKETMLHHGPNSSTEVNAPASAQSAIYMSSSSFVRTCSNDRALPNAPMHSPFLSESPSSPHVTLVSDVNKVCCVCV
jgi:hypothetical protein